MYAIAVRQSDGRIKIEMGEDVHIDPVNGGWMGLKRHGSSVGFPIWQVEDVRSTNEYDMLTDNQKKHIALGKAKYFVDDWRAARVREFERKLPTELNEREIQAIDKVLEELLEFLRPERSDRPTLEARGR